ncbi:MAG: hypothetical protein CVU64_07825 [Deltaproteobacteria bacterium HGW-Deltaproteobacteria-21]|nr:MAG: hypothetical protein CVU64_07825 [Deltaproteobacteria bacterium HGW-Deltaproteobacteria-21]
MRESRTDPFFILNKMKIASGSQGGEPTPRKKIMGKDAMGNKSGTHQAAFPLKQRGDFQLRTSSEG